MCVKLKLFLIPFRAESYGKRNGVPGELLVRVTPTKIHFVQNVAG